MTKPTILVNNRLLEELPKDLYIPPEALQIFLDMFEGPLDLLLYLIRKQNLDILQIPIAKITGQYINYINAMQVLNIEIASEYLLMAAMLLEIKSRILLPRPLQQADNIEGEEFDPRQTLINRLIEYEKIKIASQQLNEQPQAYRDYLWVDIMTGVTETKLPNVEVGELQKIWHALLLRSQKAHTEHHIKKQELSVREHMSLILKFLRELKKCTFYELFDIQLGVSYLVVNFIAVLELGKEGMIKFYQDETQTIFVELSK